MPDFHLVDQGGRPLLNKILKNGANNIGSCEIILCDNVVDVVNVLVSKIKVFVV